MCFVVAPGVESGFALVLSSIHTFPKSPNVLGSDVNMLDDLEYSPGFDDVARCCGLGYCGSGKNKSLSLDETQ